MPAIVLPSRRKLPTVTVKWLKRRKACSDQVDLFAATFGEDAAVSLTRESLRTAIRAGLNTEWLTARLLPRPMHMHLHVRIGVVNRSARLRYAALAGGARDRYFDAYAELHQGMRGLPSAPGDRQIPSEAWFLQAEGELWPRYKAAAADLRKLQDRVLEPAVVRVADLIADALRLP